VDWWSRVNRSRWRELCEWSRAGLGWVWPFGSDFFIKSKIKINGNTILTTLVSKKSEKVRT
jgi:hypothetical protein